MVKTESISMVKMVDWPSNQAKNGKEVKLQWQPFGRKMATIFWFAPKPAKYSV
ncbi:MAG: hypothetical protein Q8O88_04330 [bacterium]|nr:hypothetical protein [bacterium]